MANLNRYKMSCGIMGPLRLLLPVGILGWVLIVVLTPTAFGLNLVTGDLVPAQSPIVHSVAAAVPLAEILLPETQNLINNMRMIRDLNFGLGIAAPQIGVAKQIAIVTPSIYRVSGVVPWRGRGFVIINPQIRVVDPTPRAFVEGCLSLPFVMYSIKRASAIELDFYDEFAQHQRRIFTDYTSSIIQHEVDHLRGILFPERR
jgi:peptide deformylase